jgi:hypothetical protein
MITWLSLRMWLTHPPVRSQAVRVTLWGGPYCF